MTTAIDSAIARLQDISQALTGITIKSAPDYPIENVDPLPMSVAYVSAGRFEALNATTTLLFPTVNVEFHFSRLNLKQAYQQINAVVFEYAQRLAGDPKLNGTVDTIFTNDDGSIPFTVRPFNWGKPAGSNVDFFTQMLLFEIPIKIMTTPTAP